MRDALNEFWIASCCGLPFGAQFMQSFLAFLNELDGRFNNDVVEKVFHNPPRYIPGVKVETFILAGKSFKPRVIKVPTNQADLADQLFQFVTLPPTLPTVCPGVLPHLPLDILGIRLFKESCQLSTELGEMNKQLRIGKMVRRRNAWVLINCRDPGLKNLLPMSKHKVSKPSD